MRITESQIRALVREVLNENIEDEQRLNIKGASKRVAGDLAGNLADSIPIVGQALQLFKQALNVKDAYKVNKLIKFQSQIPQFMKACVVFTDYLKNYDFSQGSINEDIIKALFNQALKNSGATNYELVRSGSGEAGEHLALDPSNRPR